QRGERCAATGVVGKRCRSGEREDRLIVLRRTPTLGDLNDLTYEGAGVVAREIHDNSGIFLGEIGRARVVRAALGTEDQESTESRNRCHLEGIAARAIGHLTGIALVELTGAARADRVENIHP